MDTLLRDLSIISMVPRHGRLGSDRDGLFIESASLLQPLMRFLRGDSRTRLVKTLHELVDRVTLLCGHNVDLVQEGVAGCVSGMQVLHDTTYSADAVMQSHMQIVRRHLLAAAALDSRCHVWSNKNDLLASPKLEDARP